MVYGLIDCYGWFRRPQNPVAKSTLDERIVGPLWGVFVEAWKSWSDLALLTTLISIGSSSRHSMQETIRRCFPLLHQRIHLEPAHLESI